MPDDQKNGSHEEIRSEPPVDSQAESTPRVETPWHTRLRGRVSDWLWQRDKDPL